MPQPAQNDLTALILTEYTAANPARQLGRETIHLALDYCRMLQEGRCGLLSHRQIRALSRALGGMLERDWQIPADRVDERQLSGEIRLHVVGYYFLRSKKCAVIDLNVGMDGGVEDRRGWINFLSRTVFKVL